MYLVATAGEKIGALRRKLKPKLNQRELAEMLGVSRAMVANYESNRTDPPSDVTRKLAAIWRVPETWFWDGGSETPPEPSPPYFAGVAPSESPKVAEDIAKYGAQPKVGRRAFPVYGTAGASAFPIDSPDRDPDDYVEFAEELFRPDRYAIVVQGDSMHPRLEHGDYVLVQPSTKVQSGVLAVAKSSDHEYTIKVLKRVSDHIELQAINADYPTLIPDEGWEIVGYVVGRRKETGRGRYVEEGDNAGMRP